jgi:hypothetical protein
MLSQLKKVLPEEKVITICLLEKRAQKLVDFVLPKHCRQGERVDGDYSLQKGDKTYQVKVRGVVEDFRITLDDKLVLKCAMGDYIYAIEPDLLAMILD